MTMVLSIFIHVKRVPNLFIFERQTLSSFHDLWQTRMCAECIALDHHVIKTISWPLIKSIFYSNILIWKVIIFCRIRFSMESIFTQILPWKMRITKNHKSLPKKKSKSLLHNFSFEIKGCWLKSIVWSFWNHLILFILFLFVWPNILKMLWIKKYSM